MGKALINCTIYDYENFAENAYILLEKTSIIEVGSMKNYVKNERYEEFDMSGKIIMPGFVNAHTHIYSTFARGMSIPFNPKSFKDILKQLWWKLDSKLDLESIKYSALVSGVEFIKNGITTVVDHHASGVILDSLEVLQKNLSDEIGIRGIYCFETSDRFNIDECIEENTRNLSKRTEKYTFMFGLHASMTLSNNTLKKVSKILENHPIHIHVAESEEDEADSLSKYGKRIVERLNDFDILKENSILSHCVHINDVEAKIIADNNCYVALNPTSNMNNAVGLPNYKQLKTFSVKTLIGNDGLGYNLTREFLNIYYTQKYRYSNPTFFNFNDLKTIIDNNFNFVSEMLKIKIGRIKKGYKADLITFRYDSPTPISKDNIFGHLFFGIFDSPKVEDTLIDGEFIMRDSVINLDVEKINQKAREVSKRLWKRL